MRKILYTCLLVFMKESVRAEQFLYVKHALQYVNGHAVKQINSAVLASQFRRVFRPIVRKRSVQYLSERYVVEI